MIPFQATELDVQSLAVHNGQGNCLIGQPCTYCFLFHCPAILDPKLRADSNTTDHEWQIQHLFFIFGTVLGFIFGIIFERSKTNWQSMAGADFSGISALRNLVVICAKNSMALLRNTNHQPNSLVVRSDDTFEGDESKSGGETEHEDEASKTRWRDVRLTRRGSLFATRCLSEIQTIYFSSL
jgi:hypothetical protein